MAMIKSWSQQLTANCKPGVMGKKPVTASVHIPVMGLPRKTCGSSRVGQSCVAEVGAHGGAYLRRSKRFERVPRALVSARLAPHRQLTNQYDVTLVLSSTKSWPQ